MKMVIFFPLSHAFLLNGVLQKSFKVIKVLRRKGCVLLVFEAGFVFASAVRPLNIHRGIHAFFSFETPLFSLCISPPPGQGRK